MINIDEALRIAIENEAKSYALYDEASKKIKEKPLKENFSFLAKQELGHIENINKFSNEYLKRKFKYKVPKHDRKIKKLFNVMIKKKIFLTKEIERTYRLALEIERSGYEYYLELMKKSREENMKKFFKFLMQEENNHYVLLEGTYNYLKDPSLFNAGNESWNFEG